MVSASYGYRYEWENYNRFIFISTSSGQFVGRPVVQGKASNIRVARCP